MSDTRTGLDSFSTSNIYALILAAFCHVWDVALNPIPKLTSVDLDGTFFFAPLAYLAATLVTALYFSQVWLFTMSAFGVVWLDSQMAWRAQKIGMEMMQKHIAEQVESARLSSHTGFPAIPEEPRPTEKPVEAEEGVAITTVAAEPEIEIEELTSPVVTVPEVPQVIAELEPEVPLPVLAEAAFPEETVAVNKEMEAPLYDDPLALLAEMEAVHRELVQVLGARKQTQGQYVLEQAMASASVPTVVVTEDRGPPPQLPPRPSLAKVDVEEIPALPEIDDDDTALDVSSMEELEESSSSRSSLRSFGDFIAAVPGNGQEFSRPPSRLINKEAPHFPIIDDVLKEFEATLSPAVTETTESEDGSDGNHEQYEHNSGHSSEHGDSRNGSSGDENESRPDSPATSVSSSNNDEDVKLEPLDFTRPALQNDDSDICIEMGEEVEEEKETEATILPTLSTPAGEKTTVLEAEVPVVEEEKTIETLIEAIELPTIAAPVVQRPKLLRASTPRSSQKKILPPRKNNGHKRIPKKVRLSSSEKQKYLSRPAW